MNMRMPVASGTVTLSGLTLSAPDDGSTTFQVKVSFNSVMTDNLQFQFTVNNTSYDVTQSGFAAGRD